MTGAGTPRSGAIGAPPTADELAALDAACFAPSERWSIVSWGGELAAGDRVLLSRRDGSGALVGAATFQVVAEVADLHRVMVRSDHRGRRLADELVREGMAVCATRGAERMLLEVRTDNEPALALYRRLGFTMIAGRDNYYGPGHDAWVLQADLPSSGTRMEPARPAG